MAAGKTLNAKNLRHLGADRLAELVMELVQGDAALKRQARAALLEAAGGGALAAEVEKRLATIRRSRARVGWRKRRALATDLDRLRALIVDRIASQDRRAALDLLWRFLALSAPVHRRTDDKAGTVEAVFAQARADLPALLAAAKPDPVALADAVFDAGVQATGHARHDGLIPLAADALGDAGLAHLKDRIEVAMAERASKRHAPDARERIHRAALRDIADAQGDVDAYIDGYDVQARRSRTVAAAIAERLLAADRPAEALAILEAAETGRGSDLRAYTDARLAALEALGRGEEAQAARWKSFETELSAPDLRAYLARLPDFDDVEAEERALDHVRASRRIHAALSFLTEWPALTRAAALVMAHRDRWDGELHGVLVPAAQALEGRHPLAATVLRRAMIVEILSAGDSPRYAQAVAHMLECEALAQAIDDFGTLPDHAAFVANLERRYARKASFWSRLRDETS